MDDSTVRLHSSTYVPLSPPNPSNLLDVLHSWGNISLWEDLQMDGDGEWLIEGIIEGTVEGAADGSYMKDISPEMFAQLPLC